MFRNVSGTVSRNEVYIFLLCRILAGYFSPRWHNSIENFFQKLKKKKKKKKKNINKPTLD